MQQLLLDVFTPPRPNLKNFLIGENAQIMHFLHEFGLANSKCHHLYLWGPTGCGKTHLLRSTAALLNSHIYDGKNRFVFKPSGNHLIIDNIPALTPFSQIQLFNAFNSSNDGHAPKFILLAGEKHPSELNIRQDLRTRIEGGLCLRIAPLSDEEKMLALQNMAKNRGLELSDDLTEYALQNFRRDMGSLTALIDGLDRFSLEQKKPVNLNLLRYWMRRRESLVVRENETRPI